MLDVRAVASADDLDVGIRELGDDGIGPGLAVAFLDDPDALFQGDGDRIVAFRERIVLFSVLDVWTEAAFGSDDRDALVIADGSRQLEEYPGLLDRDRLDQLPSSQGCELGIFAFTFLDIRTELAELGSVDRTVLVGSELAGDLVVAVVSEHFVHILVERCVEG